MTEDSLINQYFDEYQVLSLLGHGGMARVYRGIDTHLKRYVAIKIIDKPYRKDPDYTRRFELEAQTIARLQHPNVVQLYRYGEAQGFLYMVMQYVDGTDLAGILQNYRQQNCFMENQNILSIIRETCQALDYVHAQGVIHRDIKPSNIMIDRQGHAILADFGLSLLTDVGTRGEVFGTPEYIAPEQAISSANAQPASDLYAIGVILYEIFAGQLPFYAPDPLDMAMLHLSETPPPPSRFRAEISPVIEAVILKALAKEPKERYLSGAALIADLDLALSGAARGSTSIAAQVQAHSVLLPPPQQVLQRIQPPPAPPDAPIPPTQRAVEPSRTPTEIVPPPGGANMTPPPVTTPPAAQTTNRTWVVLASMAGLLFLAILSCVVGILIYNFVTTNRSPASTASATHASLSKVTALSPTTPAPSATMPAAKTTVFDLILLARGENGLFIFNDGPDGFPLGPLQIGSGSNQIVGAEWNTQKLDAGQCVAASSGKKKARLPKGYDCTLVSTLSANTKVWEKAYDIYYNGKLVASCPASDPPCNVSITVK